MEEIFDIVEKTLSRLPEWDQSSLPARPEPPPRSFEPLIPAIQKTEPAPEADSGAFDPQAMIDAMLSPDSFDEPPVATPEEPPPVAEEIAPDAPAAEGESQTTKKTAKGKKAKG